MDTSNEQGGNNTTTTGKDNAVTNKDVPVGTSKEQGDNNITTTETDKALQEANQANYSKTSSWETQEGWIYTGHGEWTHTDNAEPTRGHGSELKQEPPWIQKWWENNDVDIAQHAVVCRGGYPNRWGEVESSWNINRFGELLIDYEDKEVVEWLRYGWPTGRLPTLAAPSLSTKNHKGATDYPQQMTKYIKKEAKYGAVIGPFKNIPFAGNIGISPLSSRPKKNSEDRRVILDLSFPIGEAVNDGIPKDTYLGFTAKLCFPKTDDFAIRIHHLGKGCYMFKMDLSRYFRQIPLDPGDYSLIGYVINREIYFDKVLPMGMRSAPFIAQRITNAIAYIHRQMHYFLLNYVDDFVGAELKNRIWKAYWALTNLLEELGVETSGQDCTPPPPQHNWNSWA